MPPGAITTPVAVIRADPHGIIRGTYTAATETLDDAYANMAAVQQLNHGHPALLLIDSRALTQMTPAVRTYYTSAAMIPLIRALAIIVGSPASRLFGTIFLRFQTPAVPTKLFTDDAMAVMWLRTYHQHWKG